jgi:small subunit ribosomal protein S6|tara:strand:- start:12 stop:347 length:336 start_codon:yes stop_codon:yes gene_type:complete
MKCYEHTYIAKQDLSVQQLEKLVGKYSEIIKNNNGKIVKTEEWGLRNLSYEINKNKKGFYYHFKLEGDGKTIEELERAENIDDMLLRYLTIKVKKNNLDTNYFEKKEDQKI